MVQVEGMDGLLGWKDGWFRLEVWMVQVGRRDGLGWKDRRVQGGRMNGIGYKDECFRLEGWNGLGWKEGMVQFGRMDGIG